MGPKANNLFKEMNIESIIGVSGEVENVIQDFINGKLKRGDSYCPHNESSHHQCHNE